MSRPSELVRNGDIVTSDFVYMRLLGDRYAIEDLTQDMGQDGGGSQPRADGMERGGRHDFCRET